MVSLKDIARELNVSVATVSKALNGANDISAARREQIENKAREMGYSPNALARALKTNKTYNIGVLFADEADNGLEHDFFASLLDSFKRKVEAEGYDITFINGSKAGRHGRSLLEHCRYRAFDGVLAACTIYDTDEMRELAASDIPFVSIDYVYLRRF